MNNIFRANQKDAEILSNISILSKAYWGYSDELMKKWASELIVSKEYIQINSVYKLLCDNIIIWYYSFIDKNDGEVELDNLFILPDYVGKGFWTLLMQDFIERVKHKNKKKIILISDPNAEIFYKKFGFSKIDEKVSPIPGRNLPIMELRLYS